MVAITTLVGGSDKASAMVRVAGGVHAGSFLVRSADTPCAITEQVPPHPMHQFEVSIGGPAPNLEPKQLTQLTMIIPNADARGPNHAFFASITFGDIALGTRYVAEMRPGEKMGGSGTVTLLSHGEDATLTFDVTSADGTSYNGVIQCAGVLRI
jgi:hypothetical protein